MMRAASRQVGKVAFPKKSYSVVAASYQFQGLTTLSGHLRWSNNTTVPLTIRNFSSTEAGKVDPVAGTAANADSKSNAVTTYDYDDYDDYEEPKTAGQKVAFYTAIAGRLALLGVGLVCVVLTGRELFPGRMNPNSLFSEAFEVLRYNEDIMQIVGDSPKAFGRDVGRNTEGRRNHIDSYKYTGDDGSQRLRVRFNIKGSAGKAMVWVEVSDRMPANEYVYIVCQNARNGQVVTIHDNRDRLEDEAMNNTDPSDSLINKFFFKSSSGASSGDGK